MELARHGSASATVQMTTNYNNNTNNKNNLSSCSQNQATPTQHPHSRPTDLTLAHSAAAVDIEMATALNPISLLLGTVQSSAPSLSVSPTAAPSFLPEMPQWKRELLQRRKQKDIATGSSTTANQHLSPGEFTSLNL